MDSESRCALARLKNDSPSVSQKVIPTTFQSFVVTGDSDTLHVGYSKLPRLCRILEFDLSLQLYSAKALSNLPNNLAL